MSITTKQVENDLREMSENSQNDKNQAIYQDIISALGSDENLKINNIAEAIAVIARERNNIVESCVVSHFYPKTSRKGILELCVKSLLHDPAYASQPGFFAKIREVLTKNLTAALLTAESSLVEAKKNHYYWSNTAYSELRHRNDFQEKCQGEDRNIHAYCNKLKKEVTACGYAVAKASKELDSFKNGSVDCFGSKHWLLQLVNDAEKAANLPAKNAGCEIELK